MNKTSHYQLTIIVPIYNEEDNMDALEERLSLFLPQALKSTCVLFVNDGSTDSSLKRIQEVCSRHQDFFYLSLQKNGGLSAAMKAGIDATASPYAGYMDADLQTTPEDFNLLLADIENYELVMGIRTNRKDTVFKRMQSRIANKFRQMMTHDGVQDTGCPLKVMHTDYAQRIPFFTGTFRQPARKKTKESSLSPKRLSAASLLSMTVRCFSARSETPPLFCIAEQQEGV